MKDYRSICRKVIATVLIFALAASCLAGCGKWEKIRAEYTYTAPQGPEESTLEIEAIPDLAEDFIMGMDASSVLAEENSGVKYYGFDGQEQDVFRTLAEAGINCIRLRLWNDPFDSEGHGYGGGNNDLATDIALGQRATKYGMKVCIDFHYSDFWADPSKQYVPKAWADMDIDTKCNALYEFTKNSLTELFKAGVDVGMVQIGNEINNGMCGEADEDKVIALLKAGSRAVREISAEYEQEIRIVVHYTRIKSPSTLYNKITKLIENELDFDIIGLSYYPFWDGGLTSMKNVVSKLIEKYGKTVVLAETSYPYTTENGDCAGNSYDGVTGPNIRYDASVQGQTYMMRDTIEAANSAGAKGIFYWEGTWIPVGSVWSTNSEKWEKYGSGWASSYAGSYDPVDAGPNYGGCSWDNQAMFDFTGHPLESLKLFGWVRYGTVRTGDGQ